MCACSPAELAEPCKYEVLCEFMTLGGGGKKSLGIILCQHVLHSSPPPLNVMAMGRVFGWLAPNVVTMASIVHDNVL